MNYCRKVVLGVAIVNLIHIKAYNSFGFTIGTFLFCKLFRQSMMNIIFVK